MRTSVRILHVDDDPAYGETTADVLESENAGFDVTTEHSPQAALETLSADPSAYDCIVSDYQMGEMDGLELLEAIQSRYPDLQAPFILLTGKGDEDVAAEALNRGASSYVQKGDMESYKLLAERVRHDVQAARAFERSKRFDTLVRALDDPVYVLDEAGQFTYVNDAFVELVGYERTEILGESPERIKAEPAIEKAEQQLRRLLASDGPDDVTFEVDIETKDGDTIPCEDHMSALPYEGEQFRGSLGVLRDISERKQREQTLRETKDRYQTLVEQNIVGLYIARDGELIYHNAPFAELLGYPGGANELAGRPLQSFVEEADRDRLHETLQQLEHREIDSSRQPFIATTQTGRSLNVELLGRGIDLDGDPAVIGTIVDVGKDEAEYWELRRERDRLDEFTSVISHDLRNPLNVAQLQLQRARDADIEAEGISEPLESVDDALDRMEELLEDLLTLAREGRTVDEREPVGISSIARKTWDNVETREASLTVTASGTINADASRLKGLFENLYRNAVEHGGPSVAVQVGSLDDGFFVEDDGSGIPEDERENVFDSGYTTATEGTGFGLSIVKEVVQAHGWRVSVTEGENGGARFEIRADQRDVYSDREETWAG